MKTDEEEEMVTLMKNMGYQSTSMELTDLTQVWKVDCSYNNMMSNPLVSDEVKLSDDAFTKKPVICGHGFLSLKKGINDQDDKYIISFNVFIKTTENFLFFIKYSFFDSNNELIATLKTQFYTKYNYTSELTCPDILSTYTNFTVVCQGKYGCSVTRIFCPSQCDTIINNKYECNAPSQLVSDAMKLLINDKGLESPDLLIYGKDNCIMKMHSSILETVSSSFQSMITLDKERKTLCLPNDGLTILEMIRFIYTGQIQNIKEVVLDLFDIAQALNITKIKSVCELYFDKYISTENVVDIFVLANKWNVNILKAKTLKFIKNNYANICVTEKFKNLKLSVPDLEEQILSTAL